MAQPHFKELPLFQKLRFAKAEAQKEINSLKSKVAELERKVAEQQMPATKRKESILISKWDTTR